MSIDCFVATYGDQVRDAYLRLLPEQHDANAKGKLDWKFGHRSAAPMAALASDGREIVGMSAYLPTDLSIDGTRCVAYQAIDSIVSEAARGKGAFTRLANTFSCSCETNRVDVVWGFPNENAAHPWFHKLCWTKLGTVPFLFKPLRAGYLLRKFRLPFDVPLSVLRDEKAPLITHLHDEADALWDRLSRRVGCSVVRDSAYLRWRLFNCPSAAYRVAGTGGRQLTGLVATHIAEKHGGRIGYVMEAIGDGDLAALLRSEMGYLREQDVEVVLAWCFPWSPNYAAFRAAGFHPLPNALRPTEIYFGARAYSARGQRALTPQAWYLSYLDSDTV